MKLTTERDEPAKPEQATKVRLRMEPFDPPLLCALAFVALFWCGLWGPDWLRPPAPVWFPGLTALMIATTITLMRAVSKRVRGSILKRVALWIVAVPTILTTLLLVLVVALTSLKGHDEDGFTFLVIASSGGVVVCGLAAMLVIAFLPSRAAAPPSP